jgi:lipopolysaccharide heptosyltransferase II
VPLRWDFDWLPRRPEAEAALRQAWDVDGSRWVVVHPGARRDNKRWPIGHFAELIRQLTAELAETRFAIVGNGSEKELTRAILRAAPDRCLDLSGRTSLWELVEWARIADLLITNDSGPMHIGAALGKPVVALFGPTEPRRTGPYGQVDQVLRLSLPCSPCMTKGCANRSQYECLRELAPETAFAAVRARWSEIVEGPAEHVH